MEPNSTTSKWQVIIKFSLIYAMLSIAVMLVFFILGQQAKSSWINSLIAFIIVCLSLYFGIKARRDESLNGFMTYGQGVGTGVLIALISGIIMSIFHFINVTFIDPDLTANIIEETKRKMIEKGDSEESIEAAMSMMEKFQSPWLVALFGLLGNLLYGLVVSLILSIFLKKENPDEGYNTLVN